MRHSILVSLEIRYWHIIVRFWWMCAYSVTSAAAGVHRYARKHAALILAIRSDSRRCALNASFVAGGREGHIFSAGVGELATKIPQHNANAQQLCMCAWLHLNDVRACSNLYSGECVWLGENLSIYATWPHIQSHTQTHTHVDKQWREWVQRC